MQSFRQLVAWQKAMQLVLVIYERTQDFPKSEIYGLTSQLRRAAVSIPSNIAEGQARYSKPEFRHYLRQARGSLAELETQILICQSLSYVSEAHAQHLLNLAAEIGKILNGLIASLTKN